MSIIFISDLHLSENTPELTDIFLQFAEHLPKEVEAIYILGDLFNVWIGDDAVTPHTQRILQALRNIADRGIALYVLPGNRDFLLGTAFANAAHAQLLPDPTVIDCYGQKVLLMHGDSLCTDDKKYQHFRRIVRHPWLKKCYLALPLSWRRKIAARLRQKSREYQQNTPKDKLDVNQQALCAAAKHHGVEVVIHGHTHQPTIQWLQTESLSFQRIVLSDWGKQGNQLQVAAPGVFRLEYFDRYN